MLSIICDHINALNIFSQKKYLDGNVVIDLSCRSFSPNLEGAIVYHSIATPYVGHALAFPDVSSHFEPVGRKIPPLSLCRHSRP